MAKVRGKGYGGLGANNYSGSRVRLKSELTKSVASINDLTG